VPDYFPVAGAGVKRQAGKMGSTVCAPLHVSHPFQIMSMAAKAMNVLPTEQIFLKEG
jgi:hypothetical protein